jgi:hypothetical protein
MIQEYPEDSSTLGYCSVKTDILINAASLFGMFVPKMKMLLSFKTSVTIYQSTCLTSQKTIIFTTSLREPQLS